MTTQINFWKCDIIVENSVVVAVNDVAIDPNINVVYWIGTVVRDNCPI